MTTLGELARLIRSKNAGPFELTFDIMYDDDASFERERASGALSRELIARTGVRELHARCESNAAQIAEIVDVARGEV